MTKIILSSVLTLFFFSQTVFAQTMPMSLAGKSALGYRFAFVNEDEDVGQEDLDYAHSLAYTYMFTDNLGMELEGMYLTGDNDGTAYATFADLLWKFQIENVLPYVRGGIGVQHEESVGDLFSNLDDSLSARAGLGVEFLLTENVAFDTEALFVFAGDNMSDNWQYRVGIKQYF